LAGDVLKNHATAQGCEEFSGEFFDLAGAQQTGAARPAFVLAVERAATTRRVGRMADGSNAFQRFLGPLPSAVLSIVPVIRILGIFLALVVPLVAAVNPRLEYALGVLAECRGEADPAATHFENARKADPLAAPLVERGVLRLLAAGDRPGAILIYQEFAAARPHDLTIQIGYADFVTQQGKGDALALKLAAETLDAALVQHPGHPQIIRRLVSLDASRAPGLLDGLSADDPAAVLLFAALSRGRHDADDAAVRAEIDRRFLLALDAHPENPVLARAASDHFRDSKRLDQAIVVARCRRPPRHPGVFRQTRRRRSKDARGSACDSPAAGTGPSGAGEIPPPSGGRGACDPPRRCAAQDSRRVAFRVPQTRRSTPSSG
jgi:tetratricopeptide (TPR) repeat protein